MTEFIDLMRKQIELEKCENYKTIQLEAMGKAMKESLNKRIQFQCLHEMQNILYSFVSSQADMNQVQMHLMQQGYMQPAADSNTATTNSGRRWRFYWWISKFAVCRLLSKS